MTHTRKRLISAILALIVCLTAIPTFTLTSYAEIPGYVKEIEHKGTSPEGYTPIFTREDLLNIKNNMAGNYILMNDIDMFYDTISPIGKYEILTSGETRDTAKAEAFSGIFDGNGYALKNLDIMYTNTATAAEGYIGLFGLVTGEIKNLTVTGSVTASSNQNLYVGTIAGYLYEGGKVSNCTASLDITGSTTGSDRAVGGFVGYSEGTVEYCSFSGSVSSNGCSGGIVGKTTIGTVSYCTNAGHISSSRVSNSNAGGIVGATIVNATVTISNCHNIGQIDSSTTGGNGALAGGILGHGSATISYCSNSATVNAKAYSHSSDISMTESCAGGAAGGISDNSTISYFYNTGNIYAHAQNTDTSNDSAHAHASGVSASVSKSNIENVYNVGNISGSSYAEDWYARAYTFVGGIIAYANGNNGVINLKNAYSIGELTATASATGNSRAYGTNIGAIVASIAANKNPVNLTNCYWPSSSGYKDVNSPQGSVIKTRVEALDDAQMLLQESYVGFPFGYKWTMGGSTDYAYPEIAGMPHSTVGSTCSCGTWGEWTVLDAATCEFEGTEYSDCTTCGARRFRETAKAEHTFGPETDQVYGSCIVKIKACTVCGFVTTSGDASNGHTPSDPVLVPPTCTERGKIYVYCLSCNTIISEQIVPKKGHNMTETTIVPPSCDEYGYTVHKCTDCDKQLLDSYTLPTGHTFGEYTPVDPGEGYALVGRRFCSVCGDHEDSHGMPIIRIEEAKIPSGNNVEVNILIENNTGLAGVIFEIGFDTTLLTLVKDPVISLGAGACSTSPFEVSKNGTIRFVYGATTANITGDGVLATLTFAVKEDLATGTELPLSISVRPGSSFCYGGTDNREEIDIPVLGVGGNVVIIDRIKGDVNGDGVVDNRDPARLLQYIADWDVFVVTASLDADGSGEVNIRDAAHLLLYVAGHDVELH